ncbi:hypothetical protein N0V90_003470 [Kalmusia sp. IMI 367209]|nr:hypothetical protein N0V90_003470 [Kalmusia sp. IMI 367209]
MLRPTLVTSVLVLLAVYPQNIRAGCYFPDGTIDKNVEYQPCSEDASNPLSTICCATNRKDGADICAPNGLCQVGKKKGSPPSDPAWTKPSCTNADWNEDGCLHVCGDDKYPFLTPCNRAAGNSSQRWCCGLSQDCCNEESNLSIEYLPIEFDPTNFTQPSSSSSSSASSKPTSSATKLAASSSAPSESATTSNTQSTTAPASSQAPTTPSEITPAPAPQTSTGLSTGSKAGIGVGVSAAAIFLVGLGIWFGRARNKRTPAQDEGPFEKNAIVYAHYGDSHGGSSIGSSHGQAPLAPKEDASMEIHEMPVFESRVELDTERKTKELLA